MSQDPDGFAQALPGAPAPWGLLGTILWGALGAFAWFAVQFAVLVTFIAWRDTAEPGSVDTAQLARDGFLLAFATIVAGPAWIAVSALASRWRGWRRARLSRAGHAAARRARCSASRVSGRC